jgi:hypothetical protein
MKPMNGRQLLDALQAMPEKALADVVMIEHSISKRKAERMKNRQGRTWL